MARMKSILTLILLFAGLSSVCFAQQELTLTELSRSQETLSGITDYRVVTIDLERWNQAANAISANNKLTFQLSGAGFDHLLSLSRYDIRAATYQTPDGSPRQLSATWRGMTEDVKAAAFTIDANFVTGYWIEGETTWQIEPLWRLKPEATKDQYIIYRTADVEVSTEERCLVINPEPDEEGDRPGYTNKPEAEEKSVGLCYGVEVALASDFAMFQAFGSAASVENFMLGNLVNVQTDFDDAFADEVQLIVSGSYIATSQATDPWSNTTLAADNAGNGLLNEFRSWGEAGNLGFNYDVACLWTNRDFDGSTVGVAFVGGICGSFRYQALQNFTTNTNSLRVLWSHELGHNFNAQHDGGNGFIMSPSVNNTNTWSQTSTNVINSFLTNASCFSSCSPPTAAGNTDFGIVYQGSRVPFFDVGSESVDTRLWQFPGGTPATSTDTHPIVTYDTPGNYAATLTVTNGSGSDTQQIPVTISADRSVRQILQFHNFEDGPADITLSNPDNQNTWVRTSTSGTLGDISAVIDNYNNERQGQPDRLRLPVANLTDVSEISLDFEYAYRRYNQTLSDQLRVRASVDGVAFNVLFTGQENGSGNFATGPDQTSSFRPAVAADWCSPTPQCISIDLSQYAGEPVVYLEIENINGYGQFMYVDNISLSALPVSLLPVEWLAFDARVMGKTARLNWSVTQTEDHAGFEVERRTANQTAWQKIGWVTARPGLETVDYNFNDADVRPGETYIFRLRQRDLDGQEDLSEVRTVTIGDATSAAIYPNPATNRARLVSPTKDGTYQLLNAAGQELTTGALRNGAAELPLDQLPAGLYFVRVIAPDGAQEVVRLLRR